MIWIDYRSYRTAISLFNLLYKFQFELKSFAIYTYLLLSFSKHTCRFPSKKICSTNLIERMNKEIRRRIKIIDSLPSEESAMKIIYLRVDGINEAWSQRSMR